MNLDLRKYFDQNRDRLIYKWDHYFEIYERHFAPLKGKDVVLLEIGVLHGGSLQMWKNYFGKGSRIIGLDIDPSCKNYEEENIEIFIGSQADRQFLRKLRSEIPKVDILIDDGGHTMSQQKVSFQELFGQVKEGGTYLIEDVHTSYWLRYGGGYRRRGTFIEFSKQLIDEMHAYHAEQRSLPVSEYTRSIPAIHFYDSIIVIEKRKREEPFRVESGKPSEKDLIEKTAFEHVKWEIKSRLLSGINRALRYFRLPGFIWK